MAHARDEILTAKELALELRCSKAQVHKLINGAIPGVLPLPAIPLGKRKKVIMRSSLEAWKRSIEVSSIGDTIPPDSEVNAADAVA